MLLGDGAGDALLQRVGAVFTACALDIALEAEVVASFATLRTACDGRWCVSLLAFLYGREFIPLGYAYNNPLPYLGMDLVLTIEDCVV